VRNRVYDDDLPRTIDPTDCSPIAVTQPHDIGTPFHGRSPGMSRKRLFSERSHPCQQRLAITTRQRHDLFGRRGWYEQLHNEVSLIATVDVNALQTTSGIA